MHFFVDAQTKKHPGSHSTTMFPRLCWVGLYRLLKFDTTLGIATIFSKIRAILKRDYVALLMTVLETSIGHWIKVALPAVQLGRLLTTHLEQVQVSDLWL